MKKFLELSKILVQLREERFKLVLMVSKYTEPITTFYISFALPITIKETINGEIWAPFH